MTQHQSLLHPSENKFHQGNGDDGKHYWLTPPDLYAQLDAELQRMRMDRWRERLAVVSSLRSTQKRKKPRPSTRDSRGKVMRYSPFAQAPQM